MEFTWSHSEKLESGHMLDPPQTDLVSTAEISPTCRTLICDPVSLSPSALLVQSHASTRPDCGVSKSSCIPDVNAHFRFYLCKLHKVVERRADDCGRALQLSPGAFGIPQPIRQDRNIACLPASNHGLDYSRIPF